MGIPLIALQGRPAPDPTEQFGRIAQLKGMLQQQQQQAAMAPGQLEQQQQQIQATQLENEQRIEQQKSTKALMQAYTEAGGDLDKTIPLAAKYGAHPDALVKLKEASLKTQMDNLALYKAQGDKALHDADLMQGAHDTVAAAKPIDKPRIYQQQLQSLQGAGINVADQPPQYPGDEAFKFIGLGIKGHKAQLDEFAKQATIDKENAQAEAAAKNPTEASLAVKATSGGADAAQAEAALKRLDESKRAARPINNLMTSNDAKDIADAIQNGDQPPTLQGLYRNAGPVRAELARRGVPLARMETDWKATQKYMGTLNGTQQVRLRQAIETASDSLDKIDSIYAEWKQLAPVSGFKIANHAALIAMKNLPGRAGAVANALDAQIADLTSELGNVYMGGNSPTDHSLSLAQKNLSSDWGPEAFEEGVKQAHLNIGIRKNSITHGAPAGVSGENTYMPPAPAAPQGGGAKGATRLYQGHTYAQQPDGSWKLQQ